MGGVLLRGLSACWERVGRLMVAFVPPGHSKQEQYDEEMNKSTALPKQYKTTISFSFSHRDRPIKNSRWKIQNLAR